MKESQTGGAINYSIIIPHYNIPDLLMRCLKSIPVREDVQVIVVDDCSPDADTYRERYPELSRPYLEFYSTEKGGSAGRARNVGLKHSKGKWLIFADADDFFLNELTDLLDYLESCTSDIVFFDALQSRENGDQMILEACFINEIIRNGISNGVETIKYDIEVPWCKAIRRDFVQKQHILFDEIPVSNDTWFSVMASYYSSSIDICPIKAYCWFQRPGSLWRAKDVRWATTRIDVQCRLALFMNRHAVNNRYIVHCQRIFYFLEQLHTISTAQYCIYSTKVSITLKRPVYLLSMIKHLFS